VKANTIEINAKLSQRFRTTITRDDYGTGKGVFIVDCTMLFV
jgi:hypothetical protein